MMLPGLYEDGYHGMNEIPEMGEMFLAMQCKSLPRVAWEGTAPKKSHIGDVPIVSWLIMQFWTCLL